MANDTTGNPYIVDTATDTAIIASGQVFQLFMFRWVSGSTADGINIQDAAGAVKLRSVGNSANYVEGQRFNPPIMFNGLKVPTLDSGKVYLYVARLR